MKLLLSVAAFALMGVAAIGAPEVGKPLALEGVKAVADRGDWGHHVSAPEILDGDEEKGWASGPMDLTQAPANLFLAFPKPTAVGQVEVVTVTSKGALRLTVLEVYARVGDGWAILGAVKENRDERLRLALRPAEVTHLRLRLRDTARDDHAWAQIREVRLFAPPEGTKPAALKPGPVADETPSERVFIREALGLRPPEPTTRYDTKIGPLGYARACIDTLIAHGTDRYGKVQSPLFVSLLETGTKKHTDMLLPSIPGQRAGDRALFGSNLQHDVMLLRACEHLSDLTGEEKYRRAARAYLRFFLERCTGTPTGLWPWGEHAHCDVYKEEPGHNTHEYLGMPPREFWEMAWEMSPKAVVGEANGLLNHVKDLNSFAFCRHTDLTQVLPDPRPAGLQLLDFPRHGGMFVRVWAFAYAKTKDPKYLQWIDRMSDHFEETRLKESGFLPVLSQYSYRPSLRPAPGSNLSVGLSMLEAAPDLGDTPTGRRLRELGREYLAKVAEKPAPAPENLGFALAYGGGDFNGDGALLQAHAYRLTGGAGHLEAARNVAKAYADINPIPAEVYTRAGVYGVLLNLMLDLHELDKDPRWLPAAERYARSAVEALYHDGLFRGAVNLWYYDSELGVNSVVYGLVRLHAAQNGRPIAPYTFSR